jgi:hypothetical protein
MAISATRSIRAAVAVCGVAAAIAGSHIAIPAAAASCPPPPTAVQPFTPWADNAQYVLTTGGSFESGTPAWTLSGGARLVADNAPNRLDPPTHSRALFLPSGGSATSACVTAPQIRGIVRFFAKNVGAADATLRVDILVKGGTYHAGMIAAGPTWAPTRILLSSAPAYKGAVTYQVRLTVEAPNAAFTVDDTYFDPYKSA